MKSQQINRLKEFEYKMKLIIFYFKKKIQSIVGKSQIDVGHKNIDIEILNIHICAA